MNKLMSTQMSTKKKPNLTGKKFVKKIEPWLTAVFQSEHLSLLVGSGLPIALTGKNSMMPRIEFEGTYRDLIKQKASEEANHMGRGEANFEDDIRISIELLKGLEIQKKSKKSKQLKKEINKKLQELLNLVIKNENQFFVEIKKKKFIIIT